MSSRPKTIEDHYIVGNINDCWLWYGKMSGIYGQYKERKFDLYKSAHVAVYLHLVGPIPENLELDHKCKNPRCVNPSHMEIVTSAENCRRRKTTKLTKENVVEIKKALLKGEDECNLARKYYVHKATIYDIKNKKTWKEI